jgi:RNA polymerase sigma-70 factor (ECF subfamily)
MADREHPSDEDLIARIARGDRDAFAALYRRRRPDVYRFAVHMIGSHAAADDVVQDVFVAVIHEASRYAPGRSAVVPWLLGIARNHVKRAVHRQRRTVSLADETVRPPAVDADPLPALARQQDVAFVRRVLAELPIRYREVIVLCDLRELSYVDAAAVLRCAVGTVRSRLHRGRALLAERLRTSESLLRTPATGLIV